MNDTMCTWKLRRGRKHNRCSACLQWNGQTYRITRGHRPGWVGWACGPCWLRSHNENCGCEYWNDWVIDIAVTQLERLNDVA